MSIYLFIWQVAVY